MTLSLYVLDQPSTTVEAVYRREYSELFRVWYVQSDSCNSVCYRVGCFRRSRLARAADWGSVWGKHDDDYYVDFYPIELTTAKYKMT